MTGPLLDWMRSRYSDSYLQLGRRETEVERDVLQELARLGIFAKKFDVGAKAFRGRVRGAFMRSGMDEEIPRVFGGKTGAGFKGAADILGNLPGGRALWIEVKKPELIQQIPGSLMALGKTKYNQVRPAGKLKPEQRAFLLGRHDDGCCVGVAWHVLDLKDILPSPWKERVR